MLRQIQTLVGTMMWSLVLLAVVLLIALPADDRFDAPPLWLLAAQFGAGAAIFLLVESIGYRTVAVDPETDQQGATTQAFAAFQTGTIVRFSLCERAGGRSYLRERLGLPPKLGGAIQEL